jgi:toxin-antitoxin system PIN domain toxin
MIVLDVNLLLYAYDAQSPFHPSAKRWLEEAFEGEEMIGLPWQTISAFIRIATTPRRSSDMLSLAQVLAVVDAWLKFPHVCLLEAGDGHWRNFRQILVKIDARGKLVPDAQLAALTMEYGGVLYTNDRDFARFPGLRWVNPLAPA